MARAVRYRTGIDRHTGALLTGRADLAQSLAFIFLTPPNTLIMALDFGTDLRSHLSEDITPALALDIYDDLVTAIHVHEPEYRVSTLQLVHVTRTGSLGIKHDGRYYPEGRFGNYAIVEPFDAVDPIPARERLSRSRGGAVA